MLTVAEPYFESDDFRGGYVILHAAFAHPLLKRLIALNAARIVSCVLTIVPMLSPGILSLVSILQPAPGLQDDGLVAVAYVQSVHAKNWSAPAIRTTTHAGSHAPANNHPNL
jgi:hypothetical protein